MSEQFHDLSREPQPWAHAVAPPFGVQVHRPEPPGVEELFRNHPLSGFLHVRYLEPLPDPERLYRYRSYRDFYDPRWRDAEWAYGQWIRQHPQNQQQRYFKEVFLYNFPSALAAICPDVIGGAYQRGFDDGWGYGAYIQYRWSYLRGYHQGWHETLYESAETAYRHGFDQTYPERYSEYFHEWSTSPRPEILSVRMYDANDDGVYEPGEELGVDYELVNYGGAPGDWTVVPGAWSGPTAPVLVRARGARSPGPPRRCGGGGGSGAQRRQAARRAHRSAAGAGGRPAER